VPGTAELGVVVTVLGRGERHGTILPASPSLMRGGTP
jgi:hypothetical protein